MGPLRSMMLYKYFPPTHMGHGAWSQGEEEVLGRALSQPRHLPFFFVDQMAAKRTSDSRDSRGAWLCGRVGEDKGIGPGNETASHPGQGAAAWAVLKLSAWPLRPQCPGLAS